MGMDCPKCDPSPNAARKAEAFTLIELLVVIAIIAILAGLAFPAVQSALGSGKKAQARNDVNQLVAAITAYRTEYGKLPFPSTTSGSDAVSADNATIISALTTTNPALNPRGIVFFEPRKTKTGKAGLVGSVFKDPWGEDYVFTLDTDYNGRIIADVGTGSKEYFTTVIVQSAGPDKKLAPATDNISNVE